MFCGTLQKSGDRDMKNGTPLMFMAILFMAALLICCENNKQEVNNEMKMNVNVNGQDFIATLELNSAVDAFVQMMEAGTVTLQLRDYSGFEKVGPLGQSLPASDRQTTTHVGDIVLYQGDQIVMFYGSNSWSYTRLGHIDDLTGWKEALGHGDVTVTFSVED